jgi:DNA mismatch repair protein MutL
MIRVLPESLVNKIAAGEVIVRPASVVKELVENAIDAGATRILIDLSNSCRNIRVRDDGCGIPREDLPAALLRHATSKIEQFEDLWQLQTRGFRGEALASIAAVARVTILTRPRGELAGARLESEPGREPTIEAAGAPEGTDVSVRDLFFNTPVRLKFLKSPTSELQYILYMVTRQALIRPDIGFVVTHERQTLLDVPPAQPWRDRVVALLGMQAADQLLEVEASRHIVTVRGFVATPAFTRKDRRFQFFSVNGRPITSRNLSNVVQQAYKGLLMTQRFAVVVLDVELPPREVDVNVHPTKEEVRFRNESMLLGVVHKAIQERLAAANLLPTMSLPDTSEAWGGPRQGELISPHSWFAPQPPPSAPSEVRWLSESPSSPPGQGRSIVELTQHVAAHRELLTPLSAGAPPSTGDLAEPQRCNVHPAGTTSAPAQPEADPEATALLLAGGGYPEPLGQIANCYIVARAGENLLLIDQHAAHERLLYLRFRERSAAAPPTQPLLIPITIDVPPAIVPALVELTEQFQALGMKLEHFGGNTFVVQTVPADVPNLDAAGVVADIADDLQEEGSLTQLDLLRDRIITRMACRAAIKAGQPLGLEEMRRLIQEIVDARLGFTCPHGRPTMILLTRAQLDRQFKRVV